MKSSYLLFGIKQTNWVIMSKEFDDYKQSLRSTIKKEVGVILVEGVCEYTDLSICEFKF